MGNFEEPGRMNRRGRDAVFAGVLAASVLSCAPARASEHDWKVASDIGAAGLVALAIGTTAVHDDWTGGKQLAFSLGATSAATYGLKQAFPEERPNGRNDESFPSGHTAISFASAGYLQRRYGWQVGIPATVAAGLVGLARVEAREHHWYDAVAGAALGEATALLISRPINDRVMFVPWADTRSGGISLSARF